MPFGNAFIAWQNAASVIIARELVKPKEVK